MNISAVIITKNEERNIRRCLESIKFVNEIIIVDDYSVDKTLEIATEYKARIYKRKFNNDFSEQRNFGLSIAKGNWVLFIDADEEVSMNLRNEIVQVTSNSKNTIKGYLLNRKDIFLGKKLNFGEWGSAKLLRLAKNGSGKWIRKVHETWNIKGKKRSLNSVLNHYSHNNLNDFIESINNFSTLHAKANKEEGKNVNIFKVILYPKLKFVDNWIFKKGFKDSTYGFVMSLMMSFHSFLSWSKLYLEKRK